MADFLERTSEKINASDSRQTIAIKAKLIEYSSLPLMTEILGGLFPSKPSFVSRVQFRELQLGIAGVPPSGNIERVDRVNNMGR